MSRFFRDEGAPRTGTKICLATTVYDAPDASYVFSLQDSREVLHRAGFQTAYYLLQGNCHVDDARNRICQAFLQSDCTHLLFIDADVSWTPKEIMALAKHDADFVGGVYPYRRDNRQWDMPVRQVSGASCQHGLVEVEGLPAGFTKISRKVIEAVAETSRHYLDDDGNKFFVMFERTLEDGTRWGGDLHFCNLWRDLGGKLYADYEMVLGHTGKQTFRGSLAGHNRRKYGTTLLHVASQIRAGNVTAALLDEAVEYAANPWGAGAELLAAVIKLAKEAEGPIIEAGSGLTTIAMAAATQHTVFCLEHSGVYAAKIRQMAAEARLTNIGLCVMPLVDGFYDVHSFKGLPGEFALGLCDGPPRAIGDRMRFFEFFGERTARIVIDDMPGPFGVQIREWAGAMGRRIEMIDNRAAVIM